MAKATWCPSIGAACYDAWRTQLIINALLVRPHRICHKSFSVRRRIAKGKTVKTFDFPGQIKSHTTYTERSEAELHRHAQSF